MSEHQLEIHSIESYPKQSVKTKRSSKVPTGVIAVGERGFRVGFREFVADSSNPAAPKRYVGPIHYIHSASRDSINADVQEFHRTHCALTPFVPEERTDALVGTILSASA